MSDSDSETTQCPLCTEDMDFTDRNFRPCKCGYQVCLWCYHNIVQDGGARCPACRTPYDLAAQSAALDPNLIAQAKKDKERRASRVKTPSRTGKIDRSQLQNVRVMQKNLVYVIGLSSSYAREEVLKKKELFGRFGKIVKVAINKKATQGPSAQSQVSYCAYVTYKRDSDAIDAIRAMDAEVFDGKMIRCTFGTTKYCANFLRNLPCNNPNCLYLHDLARDSDCITRDDNATVAERFAAQNEIVFSQDSVIRPVVVAKPVKRTPVVGAGGLDRLNSFSGFVAASVTTPTASGSNPTPSPTPSPLPPQSSTTLDRSQSFTNLSSLPAAPPPLTTSMSTSAVPTSSPRPAKSPLPRDRLQKHRSDLERDRDKESKSQTMSSRMRSSSEPVAVDGSVPTRNAGGVTIFSTINGAPALRKEESSSKERSQTQDTLLTTPAIPRPIVLPDSANSSPAGTTPVGSPYLGARSSSFSTEDSAFYSPTITQGVDEQKQFELDQDNFSMPPTAYEPSGEWVDSDNEYEYESSSTGPSSEVSTPVLSSWSDSAPSMSPPPGFALPAAGAAVSGPPPGFGASSVFAAIAPSPSSSPTAASSTSASIGHATPTTATSTTLAHDWADAVSSRSSSPSSSLLAPSLLASSSLVSSSSPTEAPPSPTSIRSPLSIGLPNVPKDTPKEIDISSAQPPEGAAWDFQKFVSDLQSAPGFSLPGAKPMHPASQAPMPLPHHHSNFDPNMIHPSLSTHMPLSFPPHPSELLTQSVFHQFPPRSRFAFAVDDPSSSYPPHLSQPSVQPNPNLSSSLPIPPAFPGDWQHTLRSLLPNVNVSFGAVPQMAIPAAESRLNLYNLPQPPSIPSQTESESVSSLFRSTMSASAQNSSSTVSALPSDSASSASLPPFPFQPNMYDLFGNKLNAPGFPSNPSNRVNLSSLPFSSNQPLPFQFPPQASLQVSQPSQPPQSSQSASQSSSQPSQSSQPSPQTSAQSSSQPSQSSQSSQMHQSQAQPSSDPSSLLLSLRDPAILAFKSSPNGNPPNLPLPPMNGPSPINNFSHLPLNNFSGLPGLAGFPGLPPNLSMPPFSNLLNPASSAQPMPLPLPLPPLNNFFARPLSQPPSSSPANSNPNPNSMPPPLPNAISDYFANSAPGFAPREMPMHMPAFSSSPQSRFFQNAPANMMMGLHPQDLMNANAAPGMQGKPPGVGQAAAPAASRPPPGLWPVRIQ